MKRIGVVLFLCILGLAALFGCEDKSTESAVTGMYLRFDNCLTFEAWLWIDGEYQGSYTSEEASTIPLAAGARSLYARSNMFVSGDTMFCWTQDFTVEDGKLTTVTLTCPGNKCTTQGGGL